MTEQSPIKPGDQMTIRETIMDVVSRCGERVFLVDAVTSRQITYGDFHQQACALAAELRRRGIHKGDRVAVIVPNCCELAVFYFACIYLGAVIVPINPALSKSEVQFILASCKPALVVAGAASVDAVKILHANALQLVTATDANLNPSALDQLEIAVPGEASDFVPLESADGEDLVVIMYTSGTSAKPKGLAHKLGRMLRSASAFTSAQEIGQDSRFYLTLSMSYMGGLYNLLVLPFL